MWYFRDNDKNQGPFDDATMRGLVANGTVQPNDYVWREGMPDWEPLSQVPALRLTTTVAPRGPANPQNPYSSDYGGTPAQASPSPAAGLGSSIPYFYLPIGGRRSAVLILIGLMTLGHCALFASNFQTLSFLEKARAQAFPNDEAAEAAGDRVDQFATQVIMGQNVIYVCFCIAFFIWIHRANNNARALGAPFMEFTPGWSVGWFFVPFANLVKPHNIMSELEKTSRDVANWKGLSGSALVSLWWLGYLGNNIFSRVIDAMLDTAIKNSNIPGMMDGCWMFIASSVVSLVTFIPLTMLVLKITAGLEVQHESGVGEAQRAKANARYEAGIPDFGV